MVEGVIGPMIIQIGSSHLHSQHVHSVGLTDSATLQARRARNGHVRSAGNRRQPTLGLRMALCAVHTRRGCQGAVYQRLGARYHLKIHFLLLKEAESITQSTIPH